VIYFIVVTTKSNSWTRGGAIPVKCAQLGQSCKLVFLRVEMKDNSAIEQVRASYNVPHWSQGYFDINDQGELTVQLPLTVMKKSTFWFIQ